MIYLHITVLDMEGLARDLIDLREATGQSQREFGERAGLNYGKIQRFESRAQPSLAIDDVAAWLEACGTNLVIYFGRVSMTNDLKTLEKDAELVEKFKRALKIPKNREMLRVLLEALYPDDQERSHKSR